MIVGAAGLLTVGAPLVCGVGGGEPDPSNLVPDGVAAGIGQLLTIQGLNLFVAGATTVSLLPAAGGPPNNCVFVFEAPSNIDRR